MFNRKVSDNAAAILWVTAGTALFTFVFASGKFAGDTASPLQILFLRYVGGLITLVAVVWRFGDSFKSYRSDKPSSHMVGAFFGAFGGGAAIYAAANMPIVDAAAIGLLQAVFTVALGIMVFGDRVMQRHWIGIVLCCCGAAIVVGSKGAFQSTDLFTWCRRQRRYSAPS
jgi:drug/metabolite transporter (DMT)-like permease